VNVDVIAASSSAATTSRATSQPVDSNVLRA
jgi:hypothetical protein